MSADNGVYIAAFPKEDGTKEYRVIHAQAIENVEAEEYVRVYFEGADTFNTEKEAFEKAIDIYKDILSGDLCPICEYGICVLPDFPKPITQYPEITASVCCQIFLSLLLSTQRFLRRTNDAS